MKQKILNMIKLYLMKDIISRKKAENYWWYNIDQIDE